jgi:glycosyltransferase involved in cell wall biosynthesis
MPAFGDHLARAWAERRPHVAHAHFWMSGTAALRGARALGTPVLQTYHALGTVKARHQGAADTSPAQRVSVESEIGRRCHRVLATCADEVAELAAMGVTADRVSVVPCGVDPAHFRPSPSASPGPRPPRVLAVGRLVPRKGFDRAIRLLARVPGAELLVAGGPAPAELPCDPEAERLRKLAAEYGVADRVRLLGAVPHEAMPALMSGADLVLSTPVYEPFGIVPLEAMACRTPVVATAVGGQLDTVLDGRTGLLLPPDCPDDTLAAAVRELLADRERLARYGRAGRERVLERFTWQRVAEGVERVYREVLAREENGPYGAGAHHTPLVPASAARHERGTDR